MPRAVRKRERTRGELVAAAEQLVAERGLDAISIDDITEAADVAKGTFYTHFADKSDLAAAIANAFASSWRRRSRAPNEGIDDAAVRMANGLSTFFAFAIAQPVRARAMIRLIPGVVDPDMPINAGIRGDVMLGLKTKRFWAASLNAAVVTLLGMAIVRPQCGCPTPRIASPILRLREPKSLTTALVALGLKQTEAARFAKTAMDNAPEGELKP